MLFWPCIPANHAGYLSIPCYLFETSFVYFLLRSVSQELSETILTMAANCSNVMSKARQPPPGVMPKGRAPSTSSLDAISPVQVFEGKHWSASPCETFVSPNSYLLCCPCLNVFSFCSPDGQSVWHGFLEPGGYSHFSHSKYAGFPNLTQFCFQ